MSISEEELSQRGSMTQPTDPMSAFYTAKKMTYEELKSRQKLSTMSAKSQSDGILSEMSDAMKQVHLEELIDTANAKQMSIPNMTADQAVVAIVGIINRGDFLFLDTLYPGLREMATRRYDTIRSNMLPGRK